MTNSHKQKDNTILVSIPAMRGFDDSDLALFIPMREIISMISI